MKTFLISVFAFLILGVVAQCAQETPKADAQAAAAEKVAVDPVKRGAYLVQMMGCNDCHSPKIITPQGPAPDPNLLLSGHPASAALPKINDKNAVKTGEWILFNAHNTAAAGPWGISFAANLTPDETGIGAWTFEQFKKALTEGKSKGLDGTRPLLPPMPWPNYIGAAEEDLQAIFAYLKSLPPIKNLPPAPVTPDKM
jgi:hypothetical protein